MRAAARALALSSAARLELRGTALLASQVGTHAHKWSPVLSLALHHRPKPEAVQRKCGSQRTPDMGSPGSWFSFFDSIQVSDAVKAAFLLCAAAFLCGCTVVPASTAHSACELLNTASSEADLAPAWYLRAGEVLEACGQDRAKADAAARACFAEARNGYRDSKECEAMP